MENLRWKTRIAVLWIFIAVAMSAHSVLTFMEPGGIEKIAEMSIGPGMMLFIALGWWVPLVMAVMSVSLKDSANHWVNMILGIIFTLLNIWHLIMDLAETSSVHQILIICSTIVVTALIAWYALKWPKQEVSSNMECS